MSFEKFTRISKFTGQVTFRKLDSLLKTTSITHKLYNPYTFCKRQFVSNSSHQATYLNPLINARYMHAQAETDIKEKTNFFTEQQLVGARLFETHEAYANCVPKPMEYNEKLAIDNVEELLDKSWISMANSDLIENFEHLSHYAFKHQANMDDERFHGVLEVLKTRCINFSDSDIRHLLKCLQLWPNSKHDKEKAFRNLWKAFEAEIMKRFTSWTVDEILFTCHLFYNLRISRMSEFSWHSLKKVGRKPQKMNRMQLIHLAFLMKMNRRLPINVYNIEYYTEQQVDKLSLNELGIFAMAISIYDIPIRSEAFVAKIIDKLIAELDTINEVSLTSLLNIIRLHKTNQDKFVILLQELERIFPRLSLHSLTVIANLQRKTLTYRETLMSKIADRFTTEINDLKIKSIDTLMMTLFVLGYDANATPFCSAAVRELVNPKRALEFERFPRSFVSTFYGSLLINHFSKESEEVCNKIFDPDFIHNYCQDDYYYLNREYLEMSYCVELDHPEYNGRKLDKKLVDMLCKSYGSEKNENAMRRSEKNTMDGSLLTDIETICQKALQSESAFYRCSVLPHFAKAFGIICYDPETKEFGSPGDNLSKVPWYLPKYAPGDGRKWFALVTGSFSQIINHTNKPIGKILVQLRHLERIGYEPIFIPYYEWQDLSSDIEKEKYILDLLHR